VLVATVALAVVIGVLHPEFFAWDQIKDVLAQSVYVGILAAGMAFLLAMRELDLSVGSVFGLTLIASGLLMRGGMAPWLAALLGILLGGGAGLVNALLVQVIAIPTIVATLATLSMFRGLALALSDGQQVTGLATDDSFFTFLGGDALGLPVRSRTGFELQAVAAAVIGGTPLRGGSATVAGAIIGAVLLGVVSTGLVYFDVPLNWSAFATGAVILGAVSLDSLLRRRRRGHRSGLAL